jgi:hypothetical protein
VELGCLAIGRKPAGTSTLQAAEQTVNRLQARPDGQELLIHIPRRVGLDLHSFPPTLLAPRLDGLADGDSVARK